MEGLVEVGDAAVGSQDSNWRFFEGPTVMVFLSTSSGAINQLRPTNS